MTRREYLRWLQQARDMLIEAAGAQLGDVGVLVYYTLSKHGISFLLPCNADAPEWPEEVVTIPPAAEESFPLRRVHRRLIEVCTGDPQTAKRLAALAGYRRCNSYVRGALTELVRWGRLVHTADGYRLAG